MTLENCEKLLEHFNKIIDGRIPRPEGHKNWHDVIANSKDRAEEMKRKIETKTRNIKTRMNSKDPVYKPYWKFRDDPRFKEKSVPQKQVQEVKKDGKKSA